MDKRGFIRTLEAVIAIIIVFVFIYVVSQRGFERSDSDVDSIKSLQEEILRGISEDESKRNCIVADFQGPFGEDLRNYNFADNDGGKCVSEIVKSQVEGNLGRFSKSYAFVVCNTENCGIPDLPNENVYTSALVITSSFEKYEPRIVRLWVW